MPDKHGTWYHSYSTGPITVPTATAIFISSTVTNVNGPNPKQRTKNDSRNIASSHEWRSTLQYGKTL